MRAVYQFSNFDKDKGFTEDVSKNLKIDIIEKNSIVFIASSPIGFEKSDYYFGINKQWFDLIDIKFSDYYLLDNRIDMEKAKKYLKEFSCIFLMGGTTREQINYLKESNIIEELKNYKGVIIGLSAGAINLAIKSLHLKNEKENETIIYDGIGLIDKTIYPHFSMEDDKILKELLKFSNKLKIYGLCDYSTIIKRGLETIFFGDIYKIENSKIEKIS